MFSIDRVAFLIISGGTVGLFTGLSIMSAIEVGFWMFRTLLELVKYAKSAQAKRKIGVAEQ